jgi:hypothetical protein
MFISYQPKRLLLASLVVAALTACGSSSDYVPGAVLSGVAATGAAMSGATVTVVCNAISGTGTVTSTGATNESGAYTITAANGKPVCLVTASKTTNGVTTTLNSIAVAEGVVNINPITNMVVAGLQVGKNAATPEQLVAAAYAPTAADVTAAQGAAVAVLNTALAAAGKPTIATGTNLISGAFSVGSAADVALDNLLVANAVTATGQPTPATATAVKAAVDAVVATNPGTSTGATGGT